MIYGKDLINTKDFGSVYFLDFLFYFLIKLAELLKRNSSLDMNINLQ